MLWESRHRFGVDTSLDFRRESLSADFVDELWTGDANVVYRFAQCDHLMVRAGVGLNYLADPQGTDIGLNLTYSADWLPFQPWIMSAEFDAGWLGNAPLLHARATVGANIRNVEVFTGYSYYTVGSSNIGGVIAGMQLWY